MILPPSTLSPDTKQRMARYVVNHLALVEMTRKLQAGFGQVPSSWSANPVTQTDDGVEFDSQAFEFDSGLARGWLSYTSAT